RLSASVSTGGGGATGAAIGAGGLAAAFARGAAGGGTGTACRLGGGGGARMVLPSVAKVILPVMRPARRSSGVLIETISSKDHDGDGGCRRGGSRQRQPGA